MNFFILLFVDNCLLTMSVRCNRIIHFRSKEPNKKHPIIDGYKNINVTSGNSKWKALSPMVLGPLDVYEQLTSSRDAPTGVHPGFVRVGDLQYCQASNLENYWQSSKIYNIDMDPSWVEGSFDDPDLVLSSSFLERRAKFMTDPKPHRRTVPKKTGYPVASYFDGGVYSYVQARIHYISWYEYLAQRTPQYAELVSMLQRGENLQILGYDGRDIEPTLQAMTREMYSTEAPFGHELVLTCMLAGIRPWSNWNPTDDMTAL